MDQSEVDNIDQLLNQVKQSFYAIVGEQWDETQPISNISATNELTLEDELNLYRNLMMLMKYKHDQHLMSTTSVNLSKLIVRENGIRKLIGATLDIEESSQKATTLEQRYQAIANVVAFMPKLCCDQSEFYGKLAPQIRTLITTQALSKDVQKANKLRKLAVFISVALMTRNKRLGKKYLVSPLIEAIKGINQANQISICNAIEIVHALIVYRFDYKYFLVAFANLFYVRTVLGDSVSHLRSVLDDILKEMMSKVKRSEHLLDDTLFTHHHSLSRLYTKRANVIENIVDVHFLGEGDGQEADLNDIDLKLIDQTVQLVLVLSSKLSDSSNVDMFLLLLERLSFAHLYTPSVNLVLMSLIDSFYERISEYVIEYPSKCIQFVVSTLERSVDDLSNVTMPKSPNSLNSSEEELNDNATNSLRIDSKSIATQIVSLVLSEKEKLRREDIVALKQCIGSLEKLAASESDDEEKAKLSALRDKLVFLDPSCLASAHKGEMSQFAASMRDLNDQLMPTRAHALVSLKHLINGRDEETMSNSQRLLDLLKVCLVDPESYIYLAAINTLAAMATVKPKRTIPFLTEAFLNDHRTVQERVNVGEVLIQLSKRLGEMAPYYSRDLMNCFFIGLKSNDPAIRISTLSNLGQLCSVLGFAMSSYINEALSAIKALLQTDECLEVRRASVMFLSLVVNGLDKDSLEAIQEQVLPIYRILKEIYSNSLDDVMRLHSQVALEQLDSIARGLLSSSTTGKSLIQML